MYWLMLALQVGMADSLPVISLPDALQRARRLDPAYVEARGDVDDAEWQRRAALSAILLPSLSLSSDATRYSSNTFNPNTASQAEIAVNAVASARYELFAGGRKVAELSSSRAGLRRAEASELQARYTTELATEADFYRALLDEQLHRVARERVGRAEEQLVIARAKVASGESVQTDSLKIRLELARARVGLLRQDSALRISRLQLGRRVGMDGPVQPAALDESAPPPLPVALADAIAQARSSGPRYAAARAAEAAAAAVVRAQGSAYLPTITLGAWSAAADKDFFPSAVRRQAVSVSASLPVWNGALRELALARARTDQATARARRLDAERAAARDVTESYAGYETARATVAVNTEAVAVARENYRVEQTRYRAGAGTILQLLEAQEGLTQAEADLVRARHDARRALAGLEALLGRRLFNDQGAR